jgi:hypothetical protein
MYLRLVICSRIAARDVPDGNRIVIGTRDIELLVAIGRDCRSQNSAFMCPPSIDAMVLLAERGRVLVFAILYSAIFLPRN